MARSSLLEHAKLELNEARAAQARGNVNYTLLHAGRALFALGGAQVEMGKDPDVQRMSDEAFGYLGDIGEQRLSAL